jgi:hypothetical protein
MKSLRFGSTDLMQHAPRYPLFGVLRAVVWLAVPVAALVVFGSSLVPDAPASADAAALDAGEDFVSPSAPAEASSTAGSADAVELLNDWVYTDEGDQSADEKSPTVPDGGDQSGDDKPKQGGGDQSGSEKPKRT